MSVSLMKYQLSELNKLLDRVVAERDQLRADLAAAIARAEAAEEYADYVAERRKTRIWPVTFADWLEWKNEV